MVKRKSKMDAVPCGQRPAARINNKDGSSRAERGENEMSFEALEQITQAERAIQERKAAAQAQAREIAANAEREGLALMQRVQAESAEQGKELLRQAEERAAEQTAQIRQEAQAQAAQLRQAAQRQLDKAADFIVEGVVKH